MSELNVNAIKKLKVAELRAELTRRGLDSKGNKPVLVERLIEAISSGDQDSVEQPAEETPQEMAADTSQEAVEVKQDGEAEADKEEVPVQQAEDPTPVEESAAPPPIEAETKAEPEKVEQSNVNNDEPEEKTEQEEEPMDQSSAPSGEGEAEQKQDEEKQKVEEKAEEESAAEPEEEEEVELDESLVVMDKYNCDINLKVMPDGLSCRPLPEGCFAYLFAGGRATWGVASGKVCFECKVSALLPVELAESEEPKQAVRVGWSVASVSMQLGEDKLSYGYDSTGKKCSNSEFSEYGQLFAEGDVITCYLDLESEEKTIAFSKNGEDLETAFTLTGEELEGKALFPHIVVKNAECCLNFGATEEPWFAAKESFTFMQRLAEDDRVPGLKGPSSKAECEVIMMVGLPASGKTHWVKEHVAENPDKNYNILGTNNIMEKMKIMGVARKREAGGYNKLMDKAAKCLQRLFELAPRKKRNYILDQTNVYLSAQKKKMTPFNGFHRKAIVCIPEKDVLKERTENRKKEGINLPENAICDMKSSFTIPTVGDYFEEVIYADQDEKASEPVVQEYHREGRSYHSRSMRGGEPPYKRQRSDDRPSRWSSHDSRGGRPGGNWSPRDRHYDNRGSGYRGGRGFHGGGGYRGGYGGGSGGGGYRQQSYGSRGGYHDKRQGSGSYYSRDQRSGGGDYRQRQGSYGSRSYGQHQSYGQQQYGGYGNQSGYGGGYQSYGQSYQTSPQQSYHQQGYSSQQQQYSNYYQGYSGSGY